MEARKYGQNVALRELREGDEGLVIKWIALLSLILREDFTETVSSEGTLAVFL